MPYLIGEGKGYPPVSGTRLRYQTIIASITGWTAKREPAYRDPFIYQNVYYKAFHCADDVPPPLYILEEIASSMKVTRTWTFDEAIKYLKEDSVSGSKTAPAPWSKYGATKSEVLNNPVGRLLVLTAINEQRYGRWTVSLKDETLPLKKITVNDREMEVLKDARGFFPAPLPYLVHQVMVFGPQNKALIEHPNLHLGNRTFGLAWHRLALQLLSVSNVIKWGDMSGFDSTRKLVDARAIYEIRRMCLINAENLDRYYKLVDFLVEPVVEFPDGKVYKFEGYNMSGSFLTLTDNAMLVLLLFHMACAYYKLEFKKHVIKIIGDDYIFTGPMTAEQFEWFVRTRGYITKTECGDIHSAEFTKLRFRKVGHLWRPVPEFDRIKGSLLINNASDVETIVQTINSALIEGWFLPDHEKNELLALRSEMMSRYPKVPGWISDYDIDRMYMSDVVLEALGKYVPIL